MEQIDPSASSGIPDGEKQAAAPVVRIRNAVILPDGTKKEPLGSGVITGILGVGGMANVYEIWNSQLEVARAVKLLHPNYTEETRQRFQTEIKITAKLHHRNIIEIHAVGHWNGLPYIEMERIEGETLEKILERRGALPVDVCSAVGIMIGRALWYAHNQEYVIYGTTYHGVIHRDLKPSNIMVSREGVVKLMDFGIARPTDASIHTTDGAILGTMQYLSPEQLDGKDPDIRTDIYSLGTILYELLTGVKAFPEHNISKLMLSKIKNDFRSLDQFDVKVPTRLRKLIHRCMTYDRDRRISDAQAFLAELGKIHRMGSGMSPEQVLKDFLNEQSAERTVVASRSSLPRQGLMAGILMALLSLGIWQGGRYVRMHAAQKSAVSQAAVPVVPRISEPAPQPAPPPVEPQVKAPDAKRGAVPKRVVPKAVPDGSVKTAPQNSERPLVDRMREQYATEDMMTIFTGEVQKRRYREALMIFNYLDAKAAVSPRAVVYKVRALRGLGRIIEEKALLASTDVNDGELFLERARIDFAGKDPVGALANLVKCEQTPAAFMESGAVRLERLYLEARCVSLQFNVGRSEALKRQALDRWYEVKSELRTSRDHAYYREADEQMQQIAAK